MYPDRSGWGLRSRSRLSAVFALAAATACTAGGRSDAGARAAWSPDSATFAFASHRDGNAEIYVAAGGDSSARNLTNNAAFDGFPSWSPDGSRITFDSNRDGDGNREIYVMNGDGSNPVNLTRNPGYDFDPAWSPDGEWIAFVSARDSDWDPLRPGAAVFLGEIYRIRPDGTDHSRLTENRVHDQAPSWSPDGRRIAFCREEEGDGAVWIMEADGSGQQVIVDGPDYECSPSFSPDGARMAYRVTRSDSAIIHVMNADGSGSRPIATPMAESYGPVWSPDGAWLCFTGIDATGEMDLFVVPVEGGPAIRLTAHAGRDEACEWRPTGG